jgi:hypothetical protein
MIGRIALIALVLGGYSYDFDSLHPSNGQDASVDGGGSFDPRQTVLPGATCNPVSGRGCGSSNYCLGRIESSGMFSSLTCHASFGMRSLGEPCSLATDCAPGFVCWVDPAFAGSSTCEQPCFDDSDCSGGLCETGGRYAIPYGRATLYRCL